MKQTGDGGYIITGYTDSIAPADAYLIKLDASGNTSWIKTYGGAGTEQGNYVALTDDGGYIVAGSSNSYGAGNVYVLKTDAAGNEQWHQTYGGAGGENGTSIEKTSDGGYIIGGWTDSYGYGGSDFFLIKIDAGGNSLWSSTYGGATTDNGAYAQQTSDGGYVIAGTSWSFGVSGSAFLVKADASGNSVWTQFYGGASTDSAYSVQETSDNGFILAGSTFTYGAGGGDMYLIKTDSAGNQSWYKTYGQSFFDGAVNVQETSDSGFIIAGTTKSFGSVLHGMLLIKTDAAGNESWHQVYGGAGDDIGEYVRQTNDNGFIFAGYTNSFGAGSNDIYVIKTDSNGVRQW